MKKDNAFSLLKSLNEHKGVDVKVTNKKYAITFNQKVSHHALALDPSLLSVNGQKEIRVMVNAEDENIEELVQQVKSVFTDYLKEMSKSAFEAKVFSDVICQMEDYDTMQEQRLEVRVEKDKLFFLSEEEKVEVLYTSMRDIYIEKRSLIEDRKSKTEESQTLYRLQFENWIILECDDAIIALHCDAIDDLFMALSKAYFMAQMNKDKKVVRDER